MEWRSLCLCAICCVALPGVLSVTKADSAPGAGMVVAVAGDVVRPDTYECSESKNLPLRDALNAAGLAGESAQVTVHRAHSSSGVTTEFITRSSMKPGLLLSAGDVVVVRLMSNPDQVIRPNAVIQPGGRPIILALEGDRVTFGDVVSQLGLPAEIVGSFSRVSSFHPISRGALSVTDVIVHGDLVEWTPPNAGMPSDVGGFAPAVSEWRAEIPSVPATATRSSENLKDSSTAIDGDTDSSREALSVPRGGNLSDGTATASELSVISFGPDSGAQLSDSSSERMRLESESSAQPASGSSGLTDSPFRFPRNREADNDASDDEAIAATEVSGSSVLESLREGTASETAPIPPEELLIRGEPSSWEGRFWQLTFGVILFIAGGLVASQKRTEASESVRTKESRVIEKIAKSSSQKSAVAEAGSSATEMHAQKNASMPSANAVARVEERRSASDTESSGFGKNAGTLYPESAELESSLTSVPVASLVGEQEWYGGEWLQKTGRKDPSSTVTVPPDQTRAVNSEAHRKLDEWSVRTSSGKSPMTDGGAFAEEVRDLNDLIQNRLPVDLTTAQLPLRITLFGRPAGPRRLRIDASHPTLSGPHLSSGVDARRGVFSKSGVSREPADKQMSPAGADTSPTDISRGLQSGISADDSFDRALTFLQRQEER